MGFRAEDDNIIGKPALYGATSGVCFARGIAAERLAARHSIAWAMVVGAGDQCCGYMTGVRVVVLSAGGTNLAAGIGGGITRT